MSEHGVHVKRVSRELTQGSDDSGGRRQTRRDVVPELVGRATAALARSLSAMPPRAQSRLLHAAAGEDVLVAAAMQPTVVERARSTSPLLPALLRGAQARRQLLEADGGTLSAAEVARLLRRTRQAVDKRRRAGRLLAVRAGASWQYPAWQFADGGPLPGLSEVLATLRHVSPWATAAFFLSRNVRLGARRPLDVLRRGEIDAVTRAARAYSEHGAA